MLFRGFVIEGVACSGKTTLLRALLAHPAWRERPGLSSVVLTEHHTQGVLRPTGPDGAYTVQDNVGLLRTHVDQLAGLHARINAVHRWREKDRPNPRIRVILERFHLTHVTSYPHLEWDHVAEIDARLAAADFQLMLLTIDRATLRTRLLADRGPTWATWLSEARVRHRLEPAHAADPDRQVDCFMQQQDEMRASARRSRMATTEILGDSASALDFLLEHAVT